MRPTDALTTRRSQRNIPTFLTTRIVLYNRNVLETGETLQLFTNPPQLPPDQGGHENPSPH